MVWVCIAYAILTLHLAMLVGHYFCHWSGIPIKYFTEATGKWPYIISLICAIMNAIGAYNRPEIDGMFITSVCISLFVMGMILFPILYSALATYRDSFKKYKDY